MRGFVVARQVIAKLERLEGTQVELGGFASGNGIAAHDVEPAHGVAVAFAGDLTLSSTRAPHSAQ